MNNKISKGKWLELKGKILEQWGEISDDELEKTKGNLEQIAGKIHVKYGEGLEAVHNKLNSTIKNINEKVF